MASRLDSVSNHLVADFVTDGSWNLQLIQQWVPAGIVSEVARIALPVGQLPDLMVWRPSHMGGSPYGLHFNWCAGVPIAPSCFEEYGIRCYP